MSETKVLTVTRLVRRMKNLLEIELGGLWVEGEVSNTRRQASGHIYFTLKDAGSQISCVLFKGNARTAQVQPEDGRKVRLYGEVSVYEARGSVQLIIKKVEPVGQGELQAKFNELKEALNNKEYFDPKHKKSLPKFPKSVGLVTSGTGAALQDMLNVFERRAPWIKLVLYPVSVQGVGAEKGIAQAIEDFNDPENSSVPAVDVIITGRGGGSLEDLWNFNELVVALAISGSKIPVVSAVGHEIDFTISDFVADMRAPTPSAAAELVSPDGEGLVRRLNQMKSQMERVVETGVQRYETSLQSMKRGVLSQSADRMLREPYQRLIQSRRELDNEVVSQVNTRIASLQQYEVRLSAQTPEKVLARRSDTLDRRREQLDRAVRDQISRHEESLQASASMLRTLGPESAFTRGFSITLTDDGELIKDPRKLKAGQTMVTKFQAGSISSTVVEVTEK